MKYYNPETISSISEKSEYGMLYSVMEPHGEPPGEQHGEPPGEQHGEPPEDVTEPPITTHHPKPRNESKEINAAEKYMEMD
jgi:hypothetical protein